MSKLEGKRCTVYGLRRKGEGHIRYIGQTVYSVEHRLRRHWTEARNGNKTARSNWMRSVRDDGGEIEPVTLCEDAVWNETEIEYIRQYRGDGHSLLNHTDGGDGWTPGQSFSPEHINSLKEAQKKRWQDDDFREKHRAAIAAERHTPEGMARMRKMAQERMADPEAEARRVEAIRKANSDPEYRRKKSEKTAERMSDPDAREHIRQVNRERMKDPENRKIAAENARKGWQDPVKAAERRKKLSEAAKRRHARERAEREVEQEPT